MATSLGGSNLDCATSIKQTRDYGYIVVGYTQSTDGDVYGNHGNLDFWVAKLSSTGSIEWQKCLGGSREDRAYEVQQTTDNGYIVIGRTGSNDGDVSGNHTNIGGFPTVDYWVVKLSSSGTIEWQKCLGGTQDDIGTSVYQTSDGGYIVAGTSLSMDGDVSGAHMMKEIWVVKLSSSGAIEWQRCLGGSGNEEANSIIQTSDGGYILAGYTQSGDGDVSGNHGFWQDFWVVKLSSLGNIEWQRCLGGSYDEVATSIKQTSDGGYIVCGLSRSNDGDVSGHHGGIRDYGTEDYWVVKLSSNGAIQWQRSLGGSSGEGANDIQRTADGGYIVVGDSYSRDGDVSGMHGYLNDIWVVKLSSSGNIMWQQCLGGTNDEYAYSVHQTSDNGFIICGKSDSDDGDVSGHHGGGDFWVVKLSPSTGITEATKPEILEISVFPNPFNSSVQITYSLPYRTEVNLAVFDIVGRMLVSLINEQKEAGTYSMNWAPGADVPSGLYLLVLKAANKTVAKQVLFMK